MLNIEKQNKFTHFFGFKIPVNKQGFVDSKTLINEIKEVNYYNTNEVPYPSLISVQYVNSELGTIQNIKELAETAHKYNAVFHCDAVQAYGHISIDVKDLNVDMMSFSGHKIGTPKRNRFSLHKKWNRNYTTNMWKSRERYAWGY